ncbi:MAG: formate dehydrogenase accessory sulfurtransferase FdhD, partial [Thermoanaerobaculia bacterium]|nr:formate dehydrogenase accessory sulfurtransferase FdhD [Thermoanaerobaculia bacterium]
GRHNAVDKLVGWALGAGRLPLADAVLVVSGRLGFEIVQKAIVAGVPVVGAVGAASTLAVALAERYGLTLATFLRPGAMNLYGFLDRVEGAAG